MRSGFAMRLAPWLLLCAGCFGAGGIDPPGDRFFYPTGLALAPGGRYLLVGNSNFDLRYNAGTVVVVDLQRVEAEIASCSGRCTDPRDEKDFLRTDSTVVIGSQITDLAVAPDGLRAYAAVRGNASLTWFDLAEDAADGQRVLSCSADPATGARSCDSTHEVTHTSYATGTLWLPAEPYALMADQNWLFTGHVDSGRVTVFDVSEGRAPRLVRVLDSFPDGVNAFGQQPRPAAPDRAWYWVVSRYSSRLMPFMVSMPGRESGEGPAVSTGPTLSVSSNNPGDDCRSIAFSPDGNRAFVANRQPPSVVVLDTTLRADGTPAGNVLATLELGTGPSKVVVQPLADGTYLVLVVCFDAQEIFVVDPELLAVVDVLRTGMGPHTLVPHPAAGRAYLANFGESTVWVLDFDPASPHFARSILSIGLPEPPSGHD
jgi:DNA-binding beta-propeller fold protein YncE